MEQFRCGDLIATPKGTTITWFVLTEVNPFFKGRPVSVVKSTKDVLTFTFEGRTRKLDKGKCIIYKRKDVLKELKVK